MTKLEFAELIDTSGDIMFDVKNKHFTICTWTNGGINIGEQYPEEPKDRAFTTSEELLDNYLVDGIPLGELSEEVNITFFN